MAADFDPTIPIGLARDTDYNFSVLMCPDVWEQTDIERLLSDPNIWRKCNPHADGIIVQKTYYPEKAKEARTDPEAKKEFLCKLLNVFQGERRIDWIKPQAIRDLQRDVRIDQLSSADGWACTVGLDLSAVGDDLYAMSLLAFNTSNGTFFADMEAWVSEEAKADSPLHALYDEWIGAGWLHCVPGAVFDTSLFLNRVAELSQHIDILGFGYDPYRSKGPINDLSAWLAARGVDAKQCVIPVRQGFATYTPLVDEFQNLVRSDPPMIYFSANPIWPWQFSNTVLAKSGDGYDNVKPVKSTANAKVDNVQSLLNALHIFDIFKSKAY